MAAERELSERFARNIGILTLDEQAALGEARVGIAGLGGIGSNVAILLARMGVAHFEFADFDTYEASNINRQYGATSDTLGERKTAVMAHEVWRINPLVKVVQRDEGVTPANADDFVRSCDICVDAIDFYSIDDHLVLHRAARRAGVTVVMGSPVGFSACMQVFDPNGMSLEEYAGIRDGMPTIEKQMRYACGIVPELAHIDYFDVSQARSGTNFIEKKGPSVACALSLAASLVATEVVLTVLGKRKSRAIPYTHQFDPYTFRYHTTLVAGGMGERNHSEALARVADKSSLVPQVFETLFMKPKATKHEGPRGALYVKQTGTGGVPLVLIPPLGADTSFWAKQFHELARTRRVIAFDPRGTGASSQLREDDTTLTLAADVLDLLDKLEVREFDVLGVALGSLVAQWVAHEAPSRVQRMVLAAAYAKADERIEVMAERWRRIASTEGMSAVFDACVGEVLSRKYRLDNDSDFKNLRTFLRLNAQRPDQFCTQSLIGVKHDATRILRSVPAETLVIHGDEDQVVSRQAAAAVAEALPRATLVQMPEGSHFVSWERAAEFNAVVMGFLTRR